MTNFERFINENPSHPLVIRLNRLSNKPLSPSGSLGKLIGQVSRLADETYA